MFVSSKIPKSDSCCFLVAILQIFLWIIPFNVSSRGRMGRSFPLYASRCTYFNLAANLCEHSAQSLMPKPLFREPDTCTKSFTYFQVVLVLNLSPSGVTESHYVAMNTTLFKKKFALQPNAIDNQHKCLWLDTTHRLHRIFQLEIQCLYYSSHLTAHHYSNLL